MTYEEIYSSWEKNPEAFWLDLAQDISWEKFPTRGLNSSNKPYYEWYNDGVANTCYNAVDRHVEAGYGEQVAIIYDSPVTQTKRKITFLELKDQVEDLGGALVSKGVQKGDRVIIYMPMVPEAIVSMLACARIGAIHSVVFGGFASNELAVRIDDAKPKVIIAGSCGIEPNGIVEYKPLLDESIDIAEHKPDFCIILQRPQCTGSLVPGRDFEWNKFVENAVKVGCTSVGGAEPLYILYTSGTTGEPKGVVRPSGGHMVSLKWTMKNFYNMQAGEVFWAASDVGWVVGHSYIVYAPLLSRNTTVLFEGKPIGTPDAGTFWRIISEYKVKSLFTAPTAFRAIKRMDPHGEFAKLYDLSSLEALFLAGERADPDTIKWAQDLLGVPVVDHWWQTETGFPMVGNPLGLGALDLKIGSSTVPMPGYKVEILNDAGNILPPNQLGSIVIKLPLPPGTLPTLWKAKQRFYESYLARFPGYYETGDAGLIDQDGYVYIMARTDDVINTAGHRLSTGAIEEVLAEHPDVAECAVIGVRDQLKGQLPLGFLCLTTGVDRFHSEIVSEVIELVRSKIGPVASFKLAIVVDRLPKTRSGKILRATMAKIADGEAYKIPATIDDKSILSEIKEALQVLGYPIGN